MGCHCSWCVELKNSLNSGLHVRLIKIVLKFVEKITVDLAVAFIDSSVNNVAGFLFTKEHKINDTKSGTPFNKKKTSHTK